MQRNERDLASTSPYSCHNHLGRLILRGLLCLIFLVSAIGCTGCISAPQTPSPSPNDTLQTRKLGRGASPQDVFTAAKEGVWRGVDNGQEALNPDALEARLFALEVAEHAEDMVRPEHQKRVKAALFGAHQVVRLAHFSGELEGIYPVPGGKVSAKQKQRALKRRRRLKPGVLQINFPKAGKRVKEQLFDANGKMRPEAYWAFSKLLGDPGHGTYGEEAWVAVHPRLLTLLYYTAHHFDRPIEVISAYRVPKRSSRKGSRHIMGRAVDITIRGVGRRRLMAYLEKSFSRVGIGWYPRSTFIHLDVRKHTYYWVDRSKPGRRQRTRKRRIRRKPRRGTDPTLSTIHLPLKKLYR